MSANPPNASNVTAPRGRAAYFAMIVRLLGFAAAARRIERSAGVPAGAASEGAQADNARSFVLRVVQPGLAGLMDGSVSTLAPIFAAVFATHNTGDAFKVGIAAATGAGISMAFSEALSDDGTVTGRGNPWVRGGITGLMTFIGGAGHTLPFLIANVQHALYAAYIVVTVELIVIAWIRHHFFRTSWGLSIFQVMGGGILVFIAAVIFGNA